MKLKKNKIHDYQIQTYHWGNPKKTLILFLHGWLDTGASFDFVTRYLEKNYYCVACDMPGYGKSSHTKSPYGYYFYEYVAFVYGLVQKISPKKPIILVGHSLGGVVASFFAGAFPELVSQFVNIEGFGFVETPSKDIPARVRKWILGLNHKDRFNVYKDISHLAHKLKSQNLRLTQDRALFLAKYMSSKVKGGIKVSHDSKHVWTEPYTSANKNEFVFWERIQAKTLLVMGKETLAKKWISPKGSFLKELKKRIKHFPNGTQLKSISDCGHMVHHDQPEALSRLILSFLGAKK